MNNFTSVLTKHLIYLSLNSARSRKCNPLVEMAFAQTIYRLDGQKWKCFFTKEIKILRCIFLKFLFAAGGL